MPEYIQRFRWHGNAVKPCMLCHAEHTDSFFFVYGDAEWTAGAISAVTGIGADECIGIVEMMRAEHGTRPMTRHPANIRLCADCMRRAKVNLPLYTEAQLAAGGEFHGIVQTDEHTHRALHRER